MELRCNEPPYNKVLDVTNDYLNPSKCKIYEKELGDLASLGKPHGIGWENSKQTKLTIEPSPKTKELRATHRGPIKVEVLKSCKITN